MTFVWVLLAVLGLLAFLLVGTYNRLVLLRQNVQESWSAIETELQRRYDLVPNLVEVVKGYARHEQDTLERVIRARNAAIQAPSSPDALAEANQTLSSALRQVFALSESYPDLKANNNFQELQRQLDETENRISQARRFYNANVRELNTACEAFPSVLIAGPMGFKPRPYFGIEDADAFGSVRISGLSAPSAAEALGASDQGHTIKLKESQKELD